MVESYQETYPEEEASSSCIEAERALDEDGQPLDPPYYLVSEIARRKLLPSTLSGKGAVSERRIQEMIEQGTLPARKATFEEEITLQRNKRIRRVTDKGVWLAAPSALVYAKQHRKRVGFPKGQRRPTRGKKTGAGEVER